MSSHKEEHVREQSPAIRSSVAAQAKAPKHHSQRWEACSEKILHLQRHSVYRNRLRRSWRTSALRPEPAQLRAFDSYARIANVMARSQFEEAIGEVASSRGSRRYRDIRRSLPLPKPLFTFNRCNTRGSTDKTTLLDLHNPNIYFQPTVLATWGDDMGTNLHAITENCGRRYP